MLWVSYLPVSQYSISASLCRYDVRSVPPTAPTELWQCNVSCPRADCIFGFSLVSVKPFTTSMLNLFLCRVLKSTLGLIATSGVSDSRILPVKRHPCLPNDIFRCFIFFCSFQPPFNPTQPHAQPVERSPYMTSIKPLKPLSSQHQHLRRASRAQIFIN